MMNDEYIPLRRTIRYETSIRRRRYNTYTSRNFRLEHLQQVPDLSARPVIMVRMLMTFLDSVPSENDAVVVNPGYKSFINSDVVPCMIRGA